MVARLMPRLVLPALLLGLVAGCSSDAEVLEADPVVEVAGDCDEAWARLNDEEARRIEELGANAPILDFNFPEECLGT